MICLYTEVSTKLLHAREVPKYFRDQSPVFQFYHFLCFMNFKNVLFIPLNSHYVTLSIKHSVKESRLVSYF